MRIAIILLLIILVSCARSSLSEDENMILEARNFSNKTIGDHDTLNISKMWMDNFLIISSGDDMVEGKEENRRLFINVFKNRPDVIYVRTPHEIEVMELWAMASETGTWEGSWTEGSEKIKIGGTYYAKWHKVNNQWRLRAEVFTPTHCSGGEFCNQR